MTYQGKEDYNFATKNHWRRWAWNRIKERTPKNVSESIVIYLPGLQDLDRPIAIRKGFSGGNMFAVDNNKEISILHRSEGKNAIHGDVFEVINSWRSNLKIDVISLDLLGGLHDSNLFNISSLLWRSCLSDCAVFCVNMLRGREIDNKSIRGNLAYVAKTIKIPQFEKHRGFMLWLSICYLLESRLLSQYKDIVYESGFSESIIMEKLIRETRPDFASYRSGNLIFDSCVFVNPITSNILYRQQSPKARRKISNSINAVAAVRTMRNEGRF